MGRPPGGRRIAERCRTGQQLRAGGKRREVCCDGLIWSLSGGSWARRVYDGEDEGGEGRATEGQQDSATAESHKISQEERVAVIQARYGGQWATRRISLSLCASGVMRE